MQMNREKISTCLLQAVKTRHVDRSNNRLRSRQVAIANR